MRRSGTRAARLRDFGDCVERWLRLRPDEVYLEAALAAVLVRKKQAGRKLSPVFHSGRIASNGRPCGPAPVAPYCVATYVSFETCPNTCPFLFDRATGQRRGCFAAADVNIRERVMKRLDDSAQRIPQNLRGVLVGLAEAFAISQLFPHGVPPDGHRGRGRDLRLHVGGDAANALVARALAGAVKGWYARGGGRVWTYTHRWRSIPREAWGRIAVLASVETPRDREAARRLGYAAAITLTEFRPGQRYEGEPRDPQSLIVYCPHEERAARVALPSARPITCVDCGLCMSERRTVAFALHGTDARPASISVDQMMSADREVHRLVVVNNNRKARKR